MRLAPRTRTPRWMILLGISSILLPDVVLGQLRILSPASLQREFGEHGSRPTFNGIIPCSTATFGSPTYGESFVGRLLKIDSSSCNPDYEEELREKYNITPGPRSDAHSLREVFLISRGGCSFVRKVAVAESLGADAVIVMDSEDSPWDRKQIAQVILADDGNGQRIRIPSVLVEKQDAAVLAGANYSGNPPLINMEWNLPQKDLVRVDYWTSANSLESLRFLAGVMTPVSMLQGYVDWQVHYYVMRMPENSTDDGAILAMCYNGDPTLCVPPPPGTTKLTAMDIMNENLKEMCIRDLYKDAVEARNPAYEGELFYPSKWWQYVNNMYRDCPLKSGLTSAQYEQCPTVAASGVEGLDMSAVQSCVQDSAQTKLVYARENNAWAPGALRINGARFSGNLEPALVIQAICSAFEEEPTECKKAVSYAEKRAVAEGFVNPPVNTVVHQGYSAWHIFLILFSFGMALITGMYVYHVYTRSGIRRALRHEVMLEVKSQLQDYYRVDDPLGVANSSSGSNYRNGGGEFEFAKLKLRGN